MIVLVYNLNYKCTWSGILKHIFYIDGAILTLGEGSCSWRSRARAPVT